MIFRNIAFILLFLSPVASANAVVYQIKASYVYNFLQFVQFPENTLLPANTINVCVVGENRFGRALKELDNASTPQGKIKIKLINHTASNTEFSPCQVLYVVGDDRALSQHALAAVSTSNVLTIGEFSEFPQLGGFIELFIDKDSVRFRINQKLIGNTSFKVAAQLLSLGVPSNG